MSRESSRCPGPLEMNGVAAAMALPKRTQRDFKRVSGAILAYSIIMYYNALFNIYIYLSIYLCVCDYVYFVVCVGLLVLLVGDV